MRGQCRGQKVSSGGSASDTSSEEEDEREKEFVGNEKVGLDILCDQRYGMVPYRTITSVKKFSGALAGSKCLCCYLDCPKTKNSDMKTGTILCTGPRIGTRSEFKTKTIVSRLPYIINVTYLLTEKRGQKSPFTKNSVKISTGKKRGDENSPPFWTTPTLLSYNWHWQIGVFHLSHPEIILQHM